MRAAELIRKGWGLACAIATVAVLVARFLFPALSNTDPNQFSHLLVFLVGQAAFDVGCAIVLTIVFRVVRWNWSGGGGIQQTAVRIVTVGVLATLVLPGYQIGRARAFFWWRLARNAYAIEEIERVDALASAGRVHDALEVANSTTPSLKGTSYEISLQSRIHDLERIVDVSKALATETSTFRGNVWNPVSNRRMFFTLAEAVRLNPQNYEAAETLRKLSAMLEGSAFDADARALCAADDSDGRLGRSLSLLELEVRRARRADSCQSARRTLENTWALSRVKCILALSDRTREPESPANVAAFTMSNVPECKASGTAVPVLERLSSRE